MTPLDVLRIISPLIQLAICVLLLLSIVASWRMRKAMDASRVSLERVIAIWHDLRGRHKATEEHADEPEAPDEHEIHIARTQGRSAEAMKAEEHAEALAEKPDYADIDMTHVDYLRRMHAEHVERPLNEREEKRLPSW